MSQSHDPRLNVPILFFFFLKDMIMVPNNTNDCIYLMENFPHRKRRIHCYNKNGDELYMKIYVTHIHLTYIMPDGKEDIFICYKDGVIEQANI